MNQSRTLRVTIRTPAEIMYEGKVRSLRVPTKTGQVGLRPSAEPCVLPVEAGLILLKEPAETKYAGTAGGLLHSDRESARLLTPMAVVGDDIDSVADQLDALLEAPTEEMKVRQMLGRLETRIIQEIRQDDDTKQS